MANTDDMGNAELGNRLRSLRCKAGLSQRALAKKVSVASATISLMEAGKISPSVGSLKRILEGIPIGLSEFFAFSDHHDETVFFAAEDLSEIGKGNLSIKQIGGNAFGRSLQILKETYGLNADTGRVLYEHMNRRSFATVVASDLTIRAMVKSNMPRTSLSSDIRSWQELNGMSTVKLLVSCC